MQRENIKLLTGLENEETVNVDVNMLLKLSDVLPLKTLDDFEKFNASLNGSEAEKAQFVSCKLPEKFCNIMHFNLL